MSADRWGPLYVAPCPSCAAAWSEFHRTNGHPLILTPRGLHHALVVLEHAAGCPWMGVRVAREARGSRDRLTAARAAAAGRRLHRPRVSLTDRPEVRVKAVRPPACESCWSALAALGEERLVLMEPEGALHVAAALTAFLSHDLPSKVASSARVLRRGGFDPMPVEVLAHVGEMA